MNIKPFALKLVRDLNQFTLKGKIRHNGKDGKIKFPIQPNDLPKVIIPKIIPKAQVLQLSQELVLTRSHLVPDFLDFFKKNITAKLRRKTT